MDQVDPGTYTAEAGRTWPDWTVIVSAPADAEMVTVRSDSPAFQNSSMRLGNIFRRTDGTLWEFALHTDGDPLQGGTLFQLTISR